MDDDFFWALQILNTYPYKQFGVSKKLLNSENVSFVDLIPI